MESIEKIISTLRLSKWGYKEVMAFTGCKRDKAYSTIKSANKGGEATKADRNEVLAVLGTDYQKAMREAYEELAAARITKAELEEQFRVSIFQGGGLC